MNWALTRLFFLTLTFQLVLCRLTQSDGYNIGVVLGSIIGALLAIGIVGAIFYFCCLRRWLGIGEPPDLGYARQNDYNLKKQAGGKPINFGIGITGKAPPYNPGGGIQGKAPPYTNGNGGQKGSGPPTSGGGAYPYDDHSKSHQRYAVGSAPRYDPPGADGGNSAPVVLSSSGEHRHSGSHSHSHHSPNQSYSSEELRMAAAAGQAYQVTTTRTYQTRNYGGHASSGGGNGSPVSAAYLGTGV